MKKISLFLLSFLLLFVTFGQIPQGYYSAADGKKQTELKFALSEIISSGYVQRTYNDLWNDYKTTDVRSDGKVWDMYSNCTFSFVTSQCGSYKTICDCYNREHSVPKSWFNDQTPMYTDLFHLYPTDGFTNGKRSNYPFGEVGSATWTGNNGGKLGKNSFPGYTGTAFEPADEYKGDFARTYFYMCTRYIDRNLTYAEGSVTFTYKNSTTDLTGYAIALLLKWHRNDPVSDKEINRNNAVYGIQKNRNPFIDYPELVEHIWGNMQDKPFQLEISITQPPVSPIKITKCNGIYIEGAAPDAKIEIYTITGQIVYSDTLIQDFISLEHLRRGVYIIKINDYTEKIVW
jgi:endonuclease I